MKTQDIEKLKEILHVLEKFLAIIITIATIGDMVVVAADQTIEIDDCKKEDEIRMEEDYATYSIKIKPPIGVAKLCVQGYIQVTYGDVQQVILLENLYTQNAYKGEDGKFILLKRPIEQEIVDALQKELEPKLPQNEEAPKLEIVYDTILCFIYKEDAQSGTYYLLNATQTQKISGSKARRILNTEYETLKLDVKSYDADDVTAIVDNLMKNMK